MARRCWSRRAPPTPRRSHAQIHEIEATLAGVPTFEPVRFSTDPAECARFWNVRKGMFPSVGAMRKVGHHGDHRGRRLPGAAARRGDARPAASARDARLPRRDHLRPRARGQPALRVHAGLQRRPPRSRATAASWTRCADMVVDDYDGSLKAEHGTGRNIAPFVELEWGARSLRAHAPHQGDVRSGGPAQSRRDHQRRSRRAPQEPEAAARGRSARRQLHRMRVLRAQVPVARPHALAAAAHRRLARDRAARARGGEARPRAMAALYDYHGIDTCAACGLCATACPVGIETGLLIKALRGRRAAPLRASHRRRPRGQLRGGDRRRARGARAADLLHGVGTRACADRSTRSGARSGGRLPKWSPALPRPPRGRTRRDARRCRPGARRLLSELRGAHHGRAARRRRRSAARCRADAPVPQGRIRRRAARASSATSAAASRSRARASPRPPTASRPSSRRPCARPAKTGRWPIVFDTSPCAYRMKRFAASRLPCRTASSSSTTRCCRAWRSSSGPSRWRSIRCAACARWARRTSSTPSPAAAAAGGVDRRRAVLRLCRRQGIQPAGAQRARAAPSRAEPSARLHARLFDEPHVRDRAFGAGRAFRIARSSISSMRARGRSRHEGALFVPCYVDAFFPEVAIATLELLERLGVEVDYPLDQTCCGQPMANSGCAKDAAATEALFVRNFARLRLHRLAVGKLHPSRARAPDRDPADGRGARSARAHLRAGRVPARRARGARVSVGRVSAQGGAAQRLRVAARAAPRQDVGDRRAARSRSRSTCSRKVKGIRFVTPQRPDECCGFGGTFSVFEEPVSARMGYDKVDRPRATPAPSTSCPADMSCLMHQKGCAERLGPADQVHPHRADAATGRAQ